MDMLAPPTKQEDHFAPWPIKPAIDLELSQETAQRIAILANKQLRNFPRLNDASIFGEHVSAGYEEGPLLLLEDHRGIELMPDDRVASHEYRMLALARNGDFLLISRPRIQSFEAYSRAVFGHDGPRIVEVDRGDIRLRVPLAAACLNDEQALSKIATAAASAGTLNICPYLSTGYDWLLGAEIARRSGCPVQICAPLPQLSRLVNDKLWFASHIKMVLGKDSVPPTYSVYGPVAAAAILGRLARTYERLVIKLPASAGSMGNLVLESAYVRSLASSELRDELLERLHAIGWRDRFPILIGVWEVAALASPSAQVWIPRAGQGAPIIEGIFGQILSGENQSFIGAAAIDLPRPLEARFYQEALEISYYFQCLGYFGRMSLDALLTGPDLGNAALHWIECNGRWGGVSIPMTAARKLPGIGGSAELLVVQRVFRDSNIPGFDTLLKNVSSWTYASDKGEGAVFLEPTDHFQQNVTFFVVAPSQAAAESIGSLVLQAVESGPARSIQ
jgi:hypothetical protein